MVKKRSWMLSLFGVINFLLYMVVVGMWISIPEETTLNLLTTIASLGLTSVMIVLNRERFSHFYKSRYFLKLMSSLVSCVLIFVILGFLNFLAYKNPLTWDVTENKINSLTEQTRSVLKDLSEEVTFTIFSNKKSYELVYSLVNLYRLENPNSKILFVDAELKPQAVREAGVTKAPAVEVSYQGRKFVTSKLSELELTNALVKVSRNNDPTLYFIKGHGEIDLSSYENEGGAHLISLLKAQTYNLRFLNLREHAKIPEDASSVIFLGSKEGFFPNEINAIKDYIKRGGSLIFALDPNFNGVGATDLQNLLSEYGISFNNDLVVDQLKHVNGSQGTVPVVHQFDKKHPISRNFEGDVFLPLVQSLTLMDKDWIELAKSNLYPAAWGETSRNELSTMKLTFTEGDDFKGPLVYAASKEIEKTKLVVLGNSTFITNTYKKFPKNFMFFLNILNWSAGEERLITLNSPVLEDRPIFMSQNQIGVIFYFTVIFCPLVLCCLAFFFYRRRSRS